MQNMLRVRIPWSWPIKTSIIKTKWFQCRLFWTFWKKDVRGCWPAAAGAIINKVLNNPSKSAIALARSLPLPPVSRIAILVRKIQMSGQVVMSNLQWCAAVHASTQHLCSLDTSTLHKPLEKKETGLSSPSLRQCVSKRVTSLKATILDPPVLTQCWLSADWWPAINQLCRLAILRHHSAVYILLHSL